MLKRMLGRTVVVAVAAMSMAVSVYATPALTASGFSNYDTSTDWNLGYQFKANSNISVYSLGSLTSGIGGNGVDVGLWNAAGLLLASAHVTSAGSQDNLFTYANVTSPVDLLAGQNYFVAAVGYTLYAQGPVDGAMAPELSYVLDAYANNDTTLSFPNQTREFSFGPSAGFFGANFEFNASTDQNVPEPASLALIGIALMGLASQRKRMAG